MKRIILWALGGGLLATSSVAWAWGGNGWNPYAPWCPRYWMEEFFGGNHYGGGPWGYGASPWGYSGGPWGGYGPYAYPGVSYGYTYAPPNYRYSASAESLSAAAQ